MSRSRKKHPCWTMCQSHSKSSKQDKQLARRAVRRRVRSEIKKAVDFEDNFLLPHRYECAHNEVWSWCRDGKQHWHLFSDYLNDPVVEIDVVTQVMRVLDGKPAINPSYDREEGYRRMMRK